MATPAKEFPILQTPRLLLRQFRPSDADDLHDCFGDAEAMRFWNFPACTSKAETAKTIPWLSKATSRSDYLSWAVADRTDDRCLGLVNYHHREARHRRLEIGYIIAPARQRQGLGAEAVSAMIDFCIEQLGVRRIEAKIDPANTASIHMAERLGFVCEGGPLRDYWFVQGRYLSPMIYALLVHDRQSP
jgi:ribosomal-protein-alanine N-acetyltransferase